MYRYLISLLGLVTLVISATSDSPDINYDHTPYDPSYAPHPKAPGHRRFVPDLYKRKYSNITWIGTHNSDALRTPKNGWSLSGNQYFDLRTQLDSGVRLIQAQGHPDFRRNGQIRLCHTSCVLIDGGSLDDYLLTTKSWLEDNPMEFVTFLFVNVGPSLDNWSDAYRRTGFDELSYVPPRSKRSRMTIHDWPTVEEMVADGKRAVSFLASGANEALVPYLLPEFQYMFETSYQNHRPDPEFACNPARPYYPRTRPVPPRLTLVNHFLYNSVLGISYPYAQLANYTNSPDFTPGAMGEHAARCRTLFERRPNFLLVDFFSEGDVWAVEYGMNAY